MSYIIDAFFVNFASYDNIGGNFYINIFLLVIFGLLAFGCVALTVYKNSMYRVVKQLRRHKADSEESARTLREIGLYDFFFVKYILSGDGRIRKMVKRAGEIAYTYEDYKALTKGKKMKSEKLDFKIERFYICEGGRDSALLVENNYYTGPLKCALTVALLAVIYITLMLVMPELLRLIDGWMAP